MKMDSRLYAGILASSLFAGCQGQDEPRTFSAITQANPAKAAPAASFHMAGDESSLKKAFLRYLEKTSLIEKWTPEVKAVMSHTTEACLSAPTFEPVAETSSLDYDLYPDAFAGEVGTAGQSFPDPVIEGDAIVIVSQGGGESYYTPSEVEDMLNRLKDTPECRDALNAAIAKL